MEQLDDNALNIYTDGSCLSHPRRGGIGYRFVTVDEDGEEVVHDSAHPGYREGTNQEMELQACVEALHEAMGPRSRIELSRFRKIVVYTDSTYVKENLNNARSAWPQAGWTTKTGTPVRNAELWKKLARLTTQRYGPRVDFVWIKGKTSQHAKAVDKLAKESAGLPLNPPLRPSRVRRKITSNQVVPGSVGMEGQLEEIRIIDDEYLPLSQTHAYRYEVVSAESPYFELVDFIYSDRSMILSAGHIYEVRFNEATDNPRIVEVLNEVIRDQKP